MSLVLDSLRKTGLTDSESKVYLALLDLGDATRGDIVGKSGVAGSKIYEILDRLKTRGLCATYSQNGIKHFKATNPNQLIAYLEEQKSAITKTEEDMHLLLPQLLARFASSKEEQEVELLSGLKGLESIFSEQVNLLKKGETCYVIGGTRSIEDSAVIAFFEKIHVRREEKGIKTQMLFNEGQRVRTLEHYGAEKFPGTKTRFVSHVSPVAINVYADRTVIIIFGEQVTAIHIRSKDVAQSFREHFEMLWKDAH